MNRTTAAPLLGHASEFDRMQAAELAWWTKYCASGRAGPRMYALYGMRYASFWTEMETNGRTVEFGSGPMPVLNMLRDPGGICVDTLMPQYIKAGLVQGGMTWTATSAEVASDEADTALLLNVLDHTTEPEALVREAYRVLAPEGRALVFVHLENDDEKHRKVEPHQPHRWLEEAGFEFAREAFLPETVYDPRAYTAVVVKHGRGH